MSNKKLITILLACIMCFSILFSGCAEESENENANINTDNNEQISTDVVGNIDSEIGDKIEEVISDVVDKFQPSSNSVIELAKKNELLYSQIKNYRDFLLYTNQDNETIRAIRDELAPGRGKDIPLDMLLDVDNCITAHFTYYYNLGHYNGGSNEYLKKYVYFKDVITFDNTLDVGLSYVIPDMIDSAYDYFMKINYAVNDELVEEDVENIYRIVKYDENILKYNTLLSIKESMAQSRYTIVPLCDDLLLRYNSDGELDQICIFVNNVYIEIGFYGDYDIPFAEKIDDIQSELLKTIINDKSATLASNVLTTVLDTADKLN